MLLRPGEARGKCGKQANHASQENHGGWGHGHLLKTTVTMTDSGCLRLELDQPRALQKS